MESRPFFVWGSAVCSSNKYAQGIYDKMRRENSTVLHKEKRFATQYIYKFRIYGKMHSKITCHKGENKNQ